MTPPPVAGNESRDVQRLVRDAQQGDRDAFDALVGLYIERVFRFVRARVPESEAEDVTQFVFVQMIEALPRYEDRGIPFTSWLFTIARHAVVDASRRRRDELPLDIAGTRLDPLRAAGHHTDDAPDGEELRAAIESLPRDQRDVVTLRFFGDLSNREIAQLLHKNEGHIRVLQFRALRALRRRLAPRLGRLMNEATIQGADS